MPDFVTETRTFIGEPTSQAASGYAGYVIGQIYRVRFTRLADGTISLQASTFPPTKAIVISEGLFERWWRK